MILIVYGTRFGTTEEALEILIENLKDKDIKIVNISKEKKVDNLENYNIIIIGGPINAGRLNKHVRNFMKKNIEILKDKKIALFITHLERDSVAKNYFSTNFPEELLNKAIVKGCFGGALYFERLPFIERKILKVITKTDKNLYQINKKNIIEFAKAINEI